MCGVFRGFWSKLQVVVGTSSEPLCRQATVRGSVSDLAPLVLQRRVNVPLRESFVAQGLLRQLPNVHLRREWTSGKRPIPNASL